MAHHHPDTAAVVSRPARRIMLIAVIVLVLATVAGLVALWPSGDRELLQPNGEGVRTMVGTVTDVREDDGEVDVRVDGEDRDYPVQVAPENFDSGMTEGARVRLLFVPEALGSGSPYVFVDFVRDVPLIALAIVYGLLVLAVARWRGLAALVGLVIAFAVIWFFVLPALMSGESPLWVALVGASAVMIVVIYVAHGVNGRATVALLGTVIGLAITAALAAWAVGAARLSGANSEEALMVPSIAPGLSLTGVLLAGIVLAGLGVLNDVTITQASAVWELRATDPAMPRWQLFRRAMRIGRDHIASTVYTIAFAYAGAALPLLLLVSAYDQPLGQTLGSGEIAEEIVRTLVSSIGLVLAIPATTLIAVLVAGARPARPVVAPRGSVTPGAAPGTASADGSATPLAGSPDPIAALDRAPVLPESAAEDEG